MADLHDPAVWREFAAIREQMGALVGQLASKAGRDDVHKYKDAVFDKLEVTVRSAVADQMKVFGHEVAKIIHAEVKAEVARQIAEHEGEAAKRAVEATTKRSGDGITPKAAAWAAFGALIVGVVAQQYAGPIISAFAKHLLFGG